MTRADRYAKAYARFAPAHWLQLISDSEVVGLCAERSACRFRSTKFEDLWASAQSADRRKIEDPKLSVCSKSFVRSIFAARLQQGYIARLYRRAVSVRHVRVLCRND